MQEAIQTSPFPTATGNLSVVRVARPLVKKLAALLPIVGKVEKTGFNPHFKYKFVEESKVLDLLRDKLAELNIMMVPRCEEISTVIVRNYKISDPDFKLKTRVEFVTEKTVTQVMMAYDIIDGDSGDTITVRMPGQGEDSGDKGSNKAVTSAQKYAILKLFLISSGDDAERAPVKTAERKSDIPTQGIPLATLEQVAELKAMLKASTKTKDQLQEFLNASCRGKKSLSSLTVPEYQAVAAWAEAKRP